MHINKNTIESLKCPKCSSGQIYKLKDGTTVCRFCGYRGK